MNNRTLSGEWICGDGDRSSRPFSSWRPQSDGVRFTGSPASGTARVPSPPVGPILTHDWPCCSNQNLEDRIHPYTWYTHRPASHFNLDSAGVRPGRGSAEAGRRRIRAPHLRKRPLDCGGQSSEVEWAPAVGSSRKVLKRLAAKAEILFGKRLSYPHNYGIIPQ
jgi:hypothetical protein